MKGENMEEDKNDKQENETAGMNPEAQETPPAPEKEAGDLQAIKDAYEKRLADAATAASKQLETLNEKLKERDEFVAQLLAGDGPEKEPEDAFRKIAERRTRQRNY